MKYTLVRKIYFHSQESGLVSKYVSKEVVSEISPQAGFEFEDSAWSRNDQTKAESISVDSVTGKCTVTLNSMKVNSGSDVEKFYTLVVQHHGWKNWLDN